MKHVFFLFTLVFGIFFFGKAQDTTRLTRTPYKLKVAIEKNAAYEEDIKATPYVFDSNNVQLYPGETVFVETEVDNGIIKSMKAVKENANPAKTIIISFSQTAKKGVHQMMMLKVTNPFTQTLVYNAKFMPLKGSKFLETDVLPVQAGISGFETWQEIITAIVLNGWRFEAK